MDTGSSSGGKKEARWILLPKDSNWLGVKHRDGKFETAVYDENSPSKLAIKSFYARDEAFRVCRESWKNHGDALIHAQFASDFNVRMVNKMLVLASCSLHLYLLWHFHALFNAYIIHVYVVGDIALVSMRPSGLMS
ncbi:hypothetical protein AMTR_s00036p00093190 [Amborella trichopoda]|uniref:Uncharacterized protein n=1 Tax=Amborella trichopoda TaxID=13333 RepID=U5CYR7_AMBTC|nr:hypothetical protein AMTR_s00036p00093190 [Amborella trichopoda]